MKKIASNSGFMGTTHSLSALASILLLIAFAPDFFYKLIGTNNLVIVVMSGVAAIGSNLWVDLDNTRSTAKKTLGIIGDGLSAVMRAISVGVFNLTKSRYDEVSKSNDNSNDPHRGFWHTLAAGVLVSLGAYALVSIKMPIQLGTLQLTVGMIFAILILFVTLQLTVVSLMSGLSRKMSKSLLVQVIVTALCLILSFCGIYLFVGPGGGYLWLAVAISIGWFVHIIGDTFTVSGTPLLWPLSKKGKRWWTYRIPPGIRAGGTAEKFIALPFFAICSLVAIIKIGSTFIK